MCGGEDVYVYECEGVCVCEGGEGGGEGVSVCVNFKG